MSPAMRIALFHHSHEHGNKVQTQSVSHLPPGVPEFVLGLPGLFIIIIFMLLLNKATPRSNGFSGEGKRENEKEDQNRYLKSFFEGRRGK